MFERYTEKARRVIFFARYEASQFGSPYIETEHLLLGMLREDKALTNRFLRSHASVESIRKQIEEHTTIREMVSTSVDLPLSDECKRVLAFAAEEAEQLSHKHIGTEHLLLGLLREEKCFATEILRERGLRLGIIRDELARTPHHSPSRSAPNPLLPLIYSRTSPKQRWTASSNPWLAAIWNSIASSRFFAAAIRGIRFSLASPAPARPQSSKVWRSGSYMERFHRSWRTSGSWLSIRD